jgi:hypothetical protein
MAAVETINGLKSGPHQSSDLEKSNVNQSDVHKASDVWDKGLKVWGVHLLLRESVIAVARTNSCVARGRFARHYHLSRGR